MNILLTSVGRRGYLVTYFKEALKKLGGKVHVSNSYETCAGFQFADATFVSPRIYCDTYIPELIRYCIQHEIKILIPLFDIDLLVLSKVKNKFKEKGIRILVSEPEIVEMCNDKWLSYLFLLKNDFDTPKTFLDIVEVLDNIKAKKLNFPLIVKPRWGMGSIGVYKAETKEELLFFYEYIKKEIENSYLKFESKLTPNEMVLIQEMIVGEEFGLDVINNLQGDYVNTYSKLKIEMRSGETDIARLVENEALQNLGSKLGKTLKHVANLDVDVLFDGTNYKVLEMNARFGGGYPFAHIAGVNLPKAIVAWQLGNEISLESKAISYKTHYKNIDII
ncbi:ATP-grasp domain-containing protein [Flavicella sediminum]|uniref:ATP-grasp domain-containing protein n=1 Tax=Flavicella sediminum TaxID=2585141 RepID=UPI00112315C6|nr:ATP-grasp domain-containing protein [Flavicella sediminum]